VLYTPREAAQRLRVGESWLRRQAAARTVPSTRLGKHLRFSSADLTAIVASGARPANGSRPRRRAAGRDLPRVGESSVHALPDDHTSQASI
jgi:excisionase family DNA binding protein